MAVRYIVDNVKEAVKFYTKYLGFVIKKDWGPVVILKKDSLELWVSGPLSSAGKTTLKGQKPMPGGSNRLVVNIHSLQKVVKEFKQNEVQILSGKVNSPAGEWIVVADPSGNPVELFETK